MMKAIQVREFGGPEVMKVEDTEIPKCSENQVLVRVKSAGINPVDVYIRAGNFGPKPFPFTPGLDVAGNVEAVGSKVTHFKKGDRVFCAQVTGGYAEYTLVDQKTCWLLPSNVSYSQGSALGVPYFTAYRCLFQRANTKPGDTVLVHGASGAVGNAAVQICKSMGIRVFGTAGTKDGLKLVKDIGADEVFNHREKAYAEQIKTAAGDDGINVILEMVADVNLNTDLDIIAPEGTIVVIGCHGETTVDPRATMMKECTVTGVLLFLTKPHEWKEMGTFMGAGMANGTLKPIIDKEYPLVKAPEAHVDVMEHTSGSKGKIVLTM